MGDVFLTERAFAEIIAEHGGRVFRVGGCVRDVFMGMTPKDIDLCVVGMVKKKFKELFPAAEEYGKSFPVFRVLLDGVKCEVAFARTERKVGRGYKGFKVSSSPKVTIKEDLYRRDLTVNAIAVDCLTGEVVDPFAGIKDIADGILRAVSPHFSDDPIRALRLAGQSARLNFAIEPATLNMASAVAAELGDEPIERVLSELIKVLTEAREPGRFFRVMAEMSLLKATFDEIAALSPENFNTAMLFLDAVAKTEQNPKVRFAALGLAFDKETLIRWNKRMTLPRNWLVAAVSVGEIRGLLRVINPENIVASIYSLNRGSLRVEEFDIISQAAGLTLPVLTLFKGKINLLPDDAMQKTLKGEALGAWLRRKHVAAVAELL